MSAQCPQCKVNASRAKAAVQRLNEIRADMHALDLRIEEVLAVLDTRSVDEDALMMIRGVPHRFLPGTGWVNA